MSMEEIIYGGESCPCFKEAVKLMLLLVMIKSSVSINAVTSVWKCTLFFFSPT